MRKCASRRRVTKRTAISTASLSSRLTTANRLCLNLRCLSVSSPSQIDHAGRWRRASSSQSCAVCRVVLTISHHERVLNRKSIVLSHDILSENAVMCTVSYLDFQSFARADQLPRMNYIFLITRYLFLVIGRKTGRLKSAQPLMRICIKCHAAVQTHKIRQLNYFSLNCGWLFAV
jgi:hypothetical protein